jgi:hypothetical protein
VGGVGLRALVGKWCGGSGAFAREVTGRCDARDDAASPRLFVAAPRATTDRKRRDRLGRLAQRLIYPFCGSPSHRGYPVGVAVEGKLDAGVPSEVLDVLRRRARVSRIAKELCLC